MKTPFREHMPHYHADRRAPEVLAPPTKHLADHLSRGALGHGVVQASACRALERDLLQAPSDPPFRMTFRRILIASDLSEASEAAARRARSLAQRGTKYRLLHVLEPAGPALANRSVAARLPTFAREREHAARDALESFAEARGLRHASAVVRSGRIAREVAREAEAFEADLVVVGARGQSRLQRVLLGSRARAVLRTQSASVLVAREEPRAQAEERFRRIAVFTDLNEPSEAAAKLALAMAEEADCELLLVHVLDPSPFGSYMSVPPEIPIPPPTSGASARAVEKAIKTLLADFNRAHLDGKGREMLVRGQPASAGPQLAKREHVDLVVVGSHGRGRVGRALIGSVAEALAERCPCSVLVARGE